MAQYPAGYGEAATHLEESSVEAPRLHVCTQGIRHRYGQPQSVLLPSRDQIEAAGGSSAAQASDSPPTLVVNPVEAENLPYPKRVNQGQKEGRTDLAPVRNCIAIGAVHSAVEQGEPAAMARPPFPGNVAPGSPIVVMVGGSPMKAPAPPRDTDAAGSAGH